MPTATKTPTKSSKTKSSAPGRGPTALRESVRPVVVSMGCPSGVGPELAAEFLHRFPEVPVILVGDRGALRAGAKSKGLPAGVIERLPAFRAEAWRTTSLVEVDGELASTQRRPGRPSEAGGVAQLLYIEEGYQLAKRYGIPLATLPVSKEAIARSGLKRARHFRGHTEWLEALDDAPYSVMCFAADKLITGLVTTHLPLRRVPVVLSAELVRRSIVEVARLARALRSHHPLIAVCSLNPHAGEGELLGKEETQAIVPGVVLARNELRSRAKIVGPIGAETALRKAANGNYDAVVAMYHDQATIPMKLIDFGGTVNVTQGLSIVRTSVDHGTAYDIAGTGQASLRGFESAVRLALRLSP